MNIGIVSFHLWNVTAEGLQAAKIARILRDQGHDVEIFTSEHNWLQGDRVSPDAGPLAGMTIHRIAAEPARVPAWWRRLAAWETAGGLRAKAAAVPNLLYGCAREDWAWAAATAGAFLARAAQRPFDVLHTRLNPPSSHLAGLLIRRRLPALPWCAYFSDPWPFHRNPPPYASSSGRLLRRRLEHRLQSVHDQADALVYPSRWLRDLQALDAAGRPRRPGAAQGFVVAHAGNLWHQVAAKPRAAVLRIRHAGFLMKERRTDALYDALRRLLARRPELRRCLRLELVGRYTGSGLPEVAADLTDIVVYDRFKRPDAIWSWLAEADVLLLVEASMEIGIYFPSKLADYLGAERPILALSPRRGVAADLLGEGAGACLLAPPDDTAAIETALEAAVDAWQQDRLETLLPTAAARLEVDPATVGAGYALAFAHARSHAHTQARGRRA